MTVGDTQEADDDTTSDCPRGPVPTTAVPLESRARLVATALALPLVLFLVLQPERLGLVPNGLDPWFYTGYAANFDDIFREVWDTHYFVSRWTVYMPGRATGTLFGPELGRLVLRWLVAAAMVMSLWSLGRRWSWNRPTRGVTALVVLTMPIFARAFLTDYVEWVVVSAGFVFVCQSLEPNVARLRSGLLGVLAAIVVVANPLAVTITVGPAVAYLARRGLSWRDRAVHAAIGTATAATTVLAGWAFFRVTYDMPNVYTPTIRFMLERSNTSDPLRSPRLGWMGAFLWIYIPPLLVLTAVAVRPLRTHFLRHRAAAAALVLMLFQYMLQWLDQFVRDGNGLEISYYWSFTYPTMGVALAVTVGAVRWTPRRAATFAAAWIGVLAITSQVRVVMPGGWWFPVLAAAVIAVTAILWRRSSFVGIGVLSVFLLLTQVAAPRYDPSSYHPYNMDPLYGQIFFHPSSTADELDAALWLEEVLDTLPSDEGLYFLGFEQGVTIIGIYGPHVTGRWLRPSAGSQIAPESMAALASGQIGQLVLFGPASLVDAAAERVGTALGNASVTLDVQDDGGLEYAIAVLTFGDPATERTTWRAAALPAQTGSDTGYARAARRGVDAPGFVLYGPYVRLAPSTYRVSVTYSSPADAASSVAAFDVARDGVAVIARELAGTGGDVRTVTLDLPQTDGDTWEFRVNWFGDHDITVESVTSEPIPSAP